MPEERHPTLRALAVADLRFYIVARFFGVMARTLVQATLVWHLTTLTRDVAPGPEFWLGVLGFVEFLPVIPTAFLGGAVADVRERRNVVWLAQAASALGAGALWLSSDASTGTLWILLATAFAIRVSWGFEFPAGQALLPALVPREIFQNTVVVSATVRNVAFVSGPTLAGFAIAEAGVGAAYALAVGLHVASLVVLLGVRRRPVENAGARIDPSAVREGIAFVRRRGAILGAMTLDMLAVIFADPTVLLAVFADEILAVGPRGYGMLYSSTAFGTLIMTLWLLFRRPLARPGRGLLLSVVVFGLAAMVFGASGHFALSVAALVVAGMADQVSQVTRSTIIQLSTPDALRGRVSAVNMVFISASNQFGASFTGFLAAATSSVFAVVAGGAACLGTAATVAWRAPALRHWSFEQEATD